MKFENSGLPQNDTIEKAFDMAWKALKTRTMHQIIQASNAIDKQAEMQLKMLKQQGLQIPEDEARKQLEAGKDQQTQMLLKARDSRFKNNIVSPAKKLMETGASPEVIAATLLIDTIKSPLDYESVVDGLGRGVSDVVAEYIDIIVYQSEEDVKLQASDTQVKHMHLAVLLTDMENVVNMPVPQGQELQLIGGAETAKRWFELAQISRGLNEDLDKNFVGTFNKLSQMCNLGLNITEQPSGELVLTQKPVQPRTPAQPRPAFPQSQNKPKAPTPPKGNGGFGNGPVF